MKKKSKSALCLIISFALFVVTFGIAFGQNEAKNPVVGSDRSQKGIEISMIIDPVQGIFFFRKDSRSARWAEAGKNTFGGNNGSQKGIIRTRKGEFSRHVRESVETD